MLTILWLWAFCPEPTLCMDITIAILRPAESSPSLWTLELSVARLRLAFAVNSWLHFFALWPWYLVLFVIVNPAARSFVFSVVYHVYLPILLVWRSRFSLNCFGWWSLLVNMRRLMCYPLASKQKVLCTFKYGFLRLHIFTASWYFLLSHSNFLSCRKAGSIYIILPHP